MRLAAISVVLLISLLLGLSSATPVAAKQLQIRAGGTYSIRVNIHKPSYMRLLAGEWELRVYFYSGLNCYNTGYWWQSGADWIYSGWYEPRIKDEDWSGTPEDRTFSLSVSVVNTPRPQEDASHNMEDLPSSGTISLRVRFLVKDIDATLSGEEDATSGYVTFTIGGMPYQYPYTKDQYGTITISSEGFNAEIDRDFEGNYRLIIDQTITDVTISDSAPSFDFYEMPSPINVNLVSTAQQEPSYELPLGLKMAVGGFTVVAIVAASVYLVLRGRKPAEELPSV